MTGEYGHAIVIAKLRHCAKFRCTEVLHRIVDGGSRTRRKERDRKKDGRKGRVPGEKGGQKSERPSYPAARTRREKRGRKKEDETVAVAAEAGGTVCCATGNGSSCRRHRK